MDQKYSNYQVQEPLATFIECVWFSEQKTDEVYKIIPDNTIELVFTTAPINRIKNGETEQVSVKSHLAGLKTIPQNIEIKKGIITGVRFRPEGLFPFINQDLSEIVNESIDLEVLFGKDIISLESQVLESMVYNRNKNALVTTIEEHFMKKIKSFENDFIIDEMIKNIRLTKGNLSIFSLGEQLGCSVKTLERKFKQKVGLTPKTYCGLYRFHQSILTMDHPSHKLSDIAYDLGYFDQMHFIKDVKRYAGMTPKEIFAQKLGLQRPTLTRH